VARPVEAADTVMWATRSHHHHVNSDVVPSCTTPGARQRHVTSRERGARRRLVTGRLIPGDSSEQPRQVPRKVLDPAPLDQSRPSGYTSHGRHLARGSPDAPHDGHPRLPMARTQPHPEPISRVSCTPLS